MKTTSQPIGQIKTKITVYCEICGCSYTRNLKSFIYENTPENIKMAKTELTKKATAKYICRICKTIKSTI